MATVINQSSNDRYMYLATRNITRTIFLTRWMLEAADTFTKACVITNIHNVVVADVLIPRFFFRLLSDLRKKQVSLLIDRSIDTIGTN